MASNKTHVRKNPLDLQVTWVVTSNANSETTGAAVVVSFPLPLAFSGVHHLRLFLPPGGPLPSPLRWVNHLPGEFSSVHTGSRSSPTGSPTVPHAPRPSRPTSEVLGPARRTEPRRRGGGNARCHARCRSAFKRGDLGGGRRWWGRRWDPRQTMAINDIIVV